MMTNDLVARVGRGLGWIGVVTASIVLGAAVAFTPLSLLPGPFQTDFVAGQWARIIGVGFVGVVLAWRLAPARKSARFSVPAAGKFMWLAVSAFALAFWPVGVLVWFNGYSAKSFTIHDMIVVDIESVRIRPASTPVESLKMRDLSSGWFADLQVTDERKRFAMPGHCVRVVVRSGRLGLDWIDDAQPIVCPASQRVAPPASRAGE